MASTLELVEQEFKISYRKLTVIGIERQGGDTGGFVIFDGWGDC
jgi:hypothetical protein